MAARFWVPLGSGSFWVPLGDERVRRRPINPSRRHLLMRRAGFCFGMEGAKSIEAVAPSGATRIQRSCTWPAPAQTLDRLPTAERPGERAEGGIARRFPTKHASAAHVQIPSWTLCTGSAT